LNDTHRESDACRLDNTMTKQLIEPLIFGRRHGGPRDSGPALYEIVMGLCPLIDFALPGAESCIGNAERLSSCNIPRIEIEERTASPRLSIIGYKFGRNYSLS